MTIRKISARTWKLYSKKSHRHLGTFHTLRAAKNRERQIKYFKSLSK